VTPLLISVCRHAAASYGHIDILEYLISQGGLSSNLVVDSSSRRHAGGDVNVIDDDGDTPLYTVENVETARWLVEHGATVMRTNSEGVSVCSVFHFHPCSDKL
jgi:ankyrin repeat protein